MNSLSPKERIPLSKQQKLVRELGQKSSFSAYREAIVGNVPLSSFIIFELYQLFLSGLGGALGILLRRIFLRRLLRSLGRGAIFGRWMTIRQPGRIAIGAHSYCDDGSVIDLRVSKNPDTKIVLGESVILGRNSLLVSKDGEIVLEDGVNISSNCRIATQSKIHIGQSTLIAAYCYVGPGNHSSEQNGLALIEQEMEIKGGVSIGKEVWIGAHSTILDGVVIGDKAIIGAHSLVRESVPPKAVVAGCPAKIIRMLP